MKPKFRTDAPFARASRSITTVRSPRSAAARAQDSPMMPAPTIARSKTPRTADWELMAYSFLENTEGAPINYYITMTDLWLWYRRPFSG
jgi:hypothetical protein